MIKLALEAAKHPVFNSMKKTLSFIDNIMILPKNPMIIRFKSTHHFEYFGISDFNRIVLNSPLMNLDVWLHPFKQKKIIFYEEYFAKGKKDFIIRKILSLFKDQLFVALTKRTYQFLKENGNKVILIPPAEKIRRKNRGKYILYAGRLVKTKNVEFILNIAKILKNEKFLIIGDGPEKTNLLEKAKGLSNVKFIPRLKTRDKVFKFYKNAKIFLHPALKDPIGFTIIEALCSGTPVLASKYAGASDYLPPEWRLDLNLNDWINMINNLLIKKNLNEEISKIIKNEHLNINDNEFYRKKAKEIEEYLNC